MARIRASDQQRKDDAAVRELVRADIAHPDAPDDVNIAEVRNRIEVGSSLHRMQTDIIALCVLHDTNKAMLGDDWHRITKFEQAQVNEKKAETKAMKSQDIPDF